MKFGSPKASVGARRRVRPLASAMMVTVLLSLVAGPALAGKTLCVFDVSGANGDAYAFMKEYQVEAKGWGVDFELKPYTNEKTAADDFKAGQCDAVLLTGVRARGFNKFTSTIEALGAVPDYKILESTVKLLSGPKAGALAKSGDYETVGIFPAGAVYLFVRDKSLKRIEDLAGKNVATLDFDAAAKVMVKQAGASMTAADVSTFSGLFNNGGVDACYAPATAYKPLELEKGIAGGGGIVRYPLAMLTLQLLVRSDGFPADFGEKSRDWAASQFDTMLKISTKAEKGIPDKYWLDVDAADRGRYDALFLDVRVRLRDTEKVFDAKMLTVLRRLRCKADASRGECAEKRE